MAEKLIALLIILQQGPRTPKELQAELEAQFGMKVCRKTVYRNLTTISLLLPLIEDNMRRVYLEKGIFGKLRSTGGQTVGLYS
jgi:hypothetical protein